MNVRREEHTIEELKAIIAEAKKDLNAATLGTREHAEAGNVYAFYVRRLENSQAEEAQRAADAKLTPSEIVDRVMR